MVLGLSLFFVSTARADTWSEINDAFDAGQPDSFAQDHLVAPGSSVAMPEPPTLLLAAVGLLAAVMFRKMRALGRPNF